MNTHATTDQLEALIRGESTGAPIEAHVAGCASCQRELAWVRAERGLLGRRPRAALPPELWQGIEARIAAQPAPLGLAGRPRAREKVRQWLPVAAAAAAALIAVSVGGFPFVGLRQQLFSGVSGKISTSGLSEREQEAESPPRSAALKVSGPVTLRLTTASADIEVLAGEEGSVRAVVTDSNIGAVELIPGANGEVRVRFDQRDGLKHGHVRVDLPRGSRVELTTASGSISVLDLGGDVSIRSASGDLTLRDVRAVDIDTASGDIAIDRFSGTGRIRTASGDAHIGTGSAPLGVFDFSSSSGELALSGRCAAGCKLSARTVSGDVRFTPEGERSYKVLFHSQSGDLQGQPEHDADDDDALPGAHDKQLKVGAGAGEINVNTVSGDLDVPIQ